MKYLKLYEHFTSILESSENREDCIRKYGKHLFGDQFKFDEVNNNIENELIKLIQDFTGNDFGELLNPVFASKLKELSKCLDVYPSVLKQEEKPVFRGTKIKFSDILKYKIEEPSLKNIYDPYGINNTANLKNRAFISNFVYKPKSVVSSWTTDWNKAFEFTYKRSSCERTEPVNIIFKDYIFGSPYLLEDVYVNSDPDLYEPVLIDENKIPESLLNSEIPVVLECNSLDGFLFNSNKMDQLSSSGHCSEFETLKINNDPIEVRVSFDTYYNERYKKFVIKNCKGW